MDEIITRLNRIESLTLLAAKNVLSVDDVAMLTGRSAKTIRNQMNEMPHYKAPNGRVYFRRDEVEDWMCSVKVTPMSSLF